MPVFAVCFPQSSRFRVVSCLPCLALPSGKQFSLAYIAPALSIARLFPDNHSTGLSQHIIRTLLINIASTAIKEATCSCGKKHALHCNCEKAAEENKLEGPRCSCRARPAGQCTCDRASTENVKPTSTCSCGARPAGLSSSPGRRLCCD